MARSLFITTRSLGTVRRGRVGGGREGGRGGGGREGGRVGVGERHRKVEGEEWNVKGIRLLTEKR